MDREGRFRDVLNESGLPSTPERSRHRNKALLSANCDLKSCTRALALTRLARRHRGPTAEGGTLFHACRQEAVRRVIRSSSGFSFGTPRRAVASRPRNACSPLPGDGSPPRSPRDDRNPWDHVGCPFPSRLLRRYSRATIRGRLKSQAACACHVKPATMGCMGGPHDNAIAMGTP
jgi:hypothetical protein